MEQMDLSERIATAPSIKVFHDESGTYGCSKWVFTGLLWTYEDRIAELVKDLKDERAEEGYEGQVHYNDFPGSFNGEYGGKVRLARRWFNLWRKKWSKKTYFNVLAIDTHHQKYQPKRFVEGFYAYNYFTATAIKGGLSWFFKRDPKINLSIISDQKSRRLSLNHAISKQPDNFEEYLSMKLGVETWKITGNTYKGPEVGVDIGIKQICCPKRGPFSEEEELLQLTDLLLGATANAVHTQATKNTKLWFGKEIAELLRDVRLTPWKQTFGLHRKLSIGYFPNSENKIYQDGPLIAGRKMLDDIKLTHFVVKDS